MGKDARLRNARRTHGDLPFSLRRWKNRVAHYVKVFCGNCHEAPHKHSADGKCLFHPTMFREPTFEEAERVAANSEPYGRAPISRLTEIAKLDRHKFPVIKVPNRHTDKR